MPRAAIAGAPRWHGRRPAALVTDVVTMRMWKSVCDTLRCAPTSVHPRDPAYARFASCGGFKSAVARSAKTKSGDPDYVGWAKRSEPTSNVANCGY